MLRGRAPVQKRTPIEELTRVMVDVAHADQEQVAVVLHEVEAENWGRGGVSMVQATAPAVGDSTDVRGAKGPSEAHSG
jgi:4-oxalocrotonate tautomerase family enzyme